MKKGLSYLLLVLFFTTSGYGTFYTVLQKVFNHTITANVDFECPEKEKEDQKEEKEKEGKDGFFECFLEYPLTARDLLATNDFLKHTAHGFLSADYSSEIFSPPEQSLI